MVTYYNSLLIIRSSKSEFLLRIKSSLSFLDKTNGGNSNIKVNKIPQETSTISCPYMSQPITVIGTIINKYILAPKDNLELFI